MTGFERMNFGYGASTLRPAKHGVRRALDNRAVLAGVGLILFFAVVALGSPLIAPHDPDFQSRPQLGGGGPLLPPAWSQGGTWAYPLGTDKLGRDILSRVVYGTRISLLVGIVPTLLSTVVGIFIGLSAGFIGGWVDEILMRFSDAVYAFPDLLFVLVIISIVRGIEVGPFQFGALLIERVELADIFGGLPLVFAALSLIAWVSIARLIRGQVLSLREREFIHAATSIGASRWRIMRVHLLPNGISPVIVNAMFLVPSFILTEAFLSFIGLGVRPPTVSWGSALRDGYASIDSVPQEVWVPTLCIILITLSFTLLGDGLRDVLDPQAGP